MKVKCTKCGYVGDEAEFPTGIDFFQKRYIAVCAKYCGNRQDPGSASLRMMPGQEHPFEYIRDVPPTDALGKTLHQSREASRPRSRRRRGRL